VGWRQEAVEGEELSDMPDAPNFAALYHKVSNKSRTNIAVQ
jgi:hypothetical protein